VCRTSADTRTKPFLGRLAASDVGKLFFSIKRGRNRLAEIFFVGKNVTSLLLLFEN